MVLNRCWQETFLDRCERRNSMKVTIYTENEFKRQFKKLAKKYHSIIDDYEVFLTDLEKNPFQGTDLGKGVRKVRMAIGSKGKGKSGGARVITYNLHQLEDDIRIDLLTIYDKGEIVNVSDAFIQYLLDKRTYPK